MHFYYLNRLQSNNNIKITKFIYCIIQLIYLLSLTKPNDFEVEDRYLSWLDPFIHGFESKVTATCDDNNLCTTDKFDKTLGCIYTPISCDDFNPCTNDNCDPVNGCSYTLACDDENVCTTDSCDPILGWSYSPISCDDFDPCTIDFCDPVSGCSHTSVPCWL